MAIFIAAYIARRARARLDLNFFRNFRVLFCPDIYRDFFIAQRTMDVIGVVACTVGLLALREVAPKVYNAWLEWNRDYCRSDSITDSSMLHEFERQQLEEEVEHILDPDRLNCSREEYPGVRIVAMQPRTSTPWKGEASPLKSPLRHLDIPPFDASNGAGETPDKVSPIKRTPLKGRQLVWE